MTNTPLLLVNNRLNALLRKQHRLKDKIILSKRINQDVTGYGDYKVLFKLQIQHTFYEGNACKHLEVQPTTATGKLLEDLQLTFITTNTGCMVLYNENSTTALLNHVELNGIWSSLSFTLRSASPYFSNITELPVENTWPTALFLSNRNGHEEPDHDQVLLHPGRYERGAQAKQVFGSTIRLQVPQRGVSYRAVIKDIAGRELMTRNTKAADESLLYINLDAIPEGKYTLRLFEMPSGLPVKEEEFIYVASPTPTLGFIQIFLRNADDQAPALFPVQAQTITEKKFAVCFESRATCWQYYMIFPGGRKAEGLCIKTNGWEPGFSEPEEVDIGNGEKGYRFTSLQPIPLKEISPFQFRLFETRTGIEQEVVNSLPVAGMNPVLPVEDRFLSPLYVNI
jgi:hypothetical protein